MRNIQYIVTIPSVLLVLVTNGCTVYSSTVSTPETTTTEITTTTTETTTTNMPTPEPVAQSTTTTKTTHTWTSTTKPPMPDFIVSDFQFDNSAETKLNPH